MQQPQQPQKEDEPEKAKEPEESDPQLTELCSLRETIMNHIFELAADLSSNDELVSQRAIALSRLLDRILKLDAQIKLLDQRHQGYQVEYIFAGKKYDVPPWQSDDFQSPWEQDPALYADYQSIEGKTQNDQSNDS